MFRILVTNVKGGVGKSTIAANLAYAFAQSGQRTQLLDLDRHASSQNWVREASSFLQQNLTADGFSLFRPQGGFPLALIELRRQLRKVSEATDILVADLTWGDHLQSELLYEFDLVIMPSAVSEVELRTTLAFAQQHEWVFKTPSHRPTLVLTPSRVRADQQHALGKAFERFTLPLVLTPPILESDDARVAYGQAFLIEHENQALADSFKAFVQAVRQAMALHQQHHVLVGERSGLGHSSTALLSGLKSQQQVMRNRITTPRPAPQDSPVYQSLQAVDPAERVSAQAAESKPLRPKADAPSESMLPRFLRAMTGK